MIIARIIAASALVALLSINKASAECCTTVYSIYHVCLGLPHEKHLPLHRVWNFPIDGEDYWIRNEADLTRPKCRSSFCGDGTVYTTDRFCGVGECDWRGCNCIGGCRQNNGFDYKGAQKIWRKNHGLKMASKHELTGFFE